MCGIGGIVYKDKLIPGQIIFDMADTMRHRGPDSFSYKVFNNVALGHTRLSIIDLETGDQPINDEEGRYWIIYNGELYNFPEIKNELLNKGHKFKTSSDTEVILIAYKIWGEKCLQKFRGMFAFAIYDFYEQIFFIARDQIGIKPLFYYYFDKTFAFASELQAIKKIGDFNKKINIRSIDQYLALQYIPAPNTIYEYVHKLEPGHYLKFNCKDFTFYKSRYWQFEFKPDQTLTYKDVLEELDNVLRDSVKKHLLADVEAGAFLSGGIDSTLILKYISELTGKPVKTFSIGFEESEFDETVYARLAADTYRSNHYQEIVKPEAFKLLPDLVKHFGEPFGDSSAIPTYYLSRMTSKHVKLALSGDGGDELFGGYKSYQNWIKGLSLPGFSFFKKKLYQQLHKIYPDRYPIGRDLNFWLHNVSILDYRSRFKLWKKEYRSYFNSEYQFFESFWNKSKKYDTLQQVQFLDLMTYLPNDILQKVDVTSMMNSLEVRTPLVDINVLEFVSRIPSHYYFNSAGENYDGKILLKKLLEHDFDKKFINRKKQGFAVPLPAWIGGDINKGFLKELLNEDAFLRVFFEKDELESLLSQNNYSAKWLLIFMEEWFRQNYKIQELES